MEEFYTPATKNCVALTSIGDYTISHWPHGFVLSCRPRGRHIPLGTFDTLEQAKLRLNEHSLYVPLAETLAPTHSP